MNLIQIKYRDVIKQKSIENRIWRTDYFTNLFLFLYKKEKRNFFREQKLNFTFEELNLFNRFINIIQQK
jgi:hypothetical protein